MMRDHYKHQACTKLYTMTRHHKPHAIPHSPLCFVDAVDHCENPILQNPAIPNCLMAKLSPSTTVKKFCSAVAIVSYLSLQTCLGIRGMANLGCRSKHHNLCNALCNQYAHANCTSSNVNHVLPSKGNKPCKVPNGYGAPDHTAGSSSIGKCCCATAMKYLHARHYVGLAQTKGHKLHIVLRRPRKLHKVVVNSSRIAVRQCVPHTNCKMEGLVHPVMLMQLQTHLPKSQSPVR